jgi:hypothetical protein
MWEAKMKSKLALIVGGIALLLAAVPVIAHHSFTAEFDITKSIKLTGTVTKMEWVNPHSWIWMDVTELCEGGLQAYTTKSWKCQPTNKVKRPNWGVELAGSAALARLGWHKGSLKVGDVIVVEGSRARDGSTHGNAHTVQSGGQVLDPGSSSGRQVQ